MIVLWSVLLQIIWLLINQHGSHMGNTCVTRLLKVMETGLITIIIYVLHYPTRDLLRRLVLLIQVHY